MIRNNEVSKFIMSGCKSNVKDSVTDKKVGPSLSLSGLLSEYLDQDHFHRRIKRHGREDAHSFLGADVNLAGKNINIVENVGQVLIQISKEIRLGPSMNTVCI